MAFLSPSSSKIVKALGVVFGDIGTSPIYTIGAILLFILPTIENILGLLSLIVWSLIIIISVQYAWLAMNLGSKGEGGTIVLKGLLTSNLKNPKVISFVSVLTLIGVALFIGDGVITPAISILSAVEGIRLDTGVCRDLGRVDSIDRYLYCLCLVYIPEKRDGACRLGIRADHVGLVSFSGGHRDNIDRIRAAGSPCPQSFVCHWLSDAEWLGVVHYPFRSPSLCYRGRSSLC